MAATATTCFATAGVSPPVRPATARPAYSLNPSAEAASGAENPTNTDTQPVRNPSSGWNSRDR